MRRMCQSLDLFVVSCLFVTVQSHTGKTLPPQNVSLRWISDLKVEGSWAPPEHSVENCKYEVNFETNEEHSFRNISNLTEFSKPLDCVMEGGFLHFSVRSVCNGSRSEAAVVNITYPELVKNLKCILTSSTQAECSWEAASHTNVTFYYRYLGSSDTDELQWCPSYRNTDHMTTVCDLQLEVDKLKRIYIVFKGTVDNVLVRNTFDRDLFHNVRLPPLEWNVTKTGDKFNITWNPPDITLKLEYIINYTECGQQKEIIITQTSATSTQLAVVPHCSYRMTMKANCSSKCNRVTFQMPWSEEKYFDADTDTNALVSAAIIIPLMFAGLAALAFVCCRKNKEKVFPKVPQPRDLLSEISDNNNKISVRNLYTPAEEEENCKIALVIDPQVSKPNC
ncbi:cytokine receptor common subunit beta-like [Channa argus]|uniref:cytokine receptor common subunit beta-like n=1 Tax=Channa argus TaxID=215402 RepID=UPI00294472CF|nr:hypothetical protein Q8A73_013318 [Channa argus]